MRNYFTFDGKNSKDFNTYIARSNGFDAAEPDVENVSVPGKSGDLTVSHGRYKNFTAQVYVYIPDNMQTNTKALAAYLLSKTGYVRYEEAIHPEEYRMARFSGEFEVDVSDRVAAGIQLNFDCKPQKFLKSGEYPVEFTASGTLENPTLYASKPLMRVYGAGSIVFNHDIVRISTAPSAGYTDIDCEIMDAYCGTENRNAYVVFESDSVTLEPGDNNIILNGVTAEITPRWWTI